MSIITVWLSDMKMGYCKTGWWLSQKFCCLELADEGEGCEEWRNWGGVEPFRWFAYIFFAVSYPASYTGQPVDTLDVRHFSPSLPHSSFDVLPLTLQARESRRSSASSTGS